MTPSPALIAARDEHEARLRDLQLSHHGSIVGCQGYHDQRRPAGRTVIARFVVEHADGSIEPLCARCAYSWGGETDSPRVGRLPIRYPGR